MFGLSFSWNNHGTKLELVHAAVTTTRHCTITNKVVEKIVVLSNIGYDYDCGKKLAKQIPHFNIH